MTFNHQCSPISFGTRLIGPGQPCFIIAEAGVNHNGQVNLACELIDAAKSAGADAVKFQTFKTEKLVAKQTPMAEYQHDALKGFQSQADLLRSLEIDAKGFQTIFDHAKSVAMPIFSTPDEEISADLLDQLQVPAFKIGSGEVTNQPFLAYLAKKNRPLILSTGMSTMAEVAIALETIFRAGTCQVALLHCVSSYPAPFESLNLRVMAIMYKCFGLPVGFSDHTLGTEAALAAVALGACIIEKHFTLDRKMQGPDHSSSLEPNSFAMMVSQIRNVEASLGHGRKEPAAIELPNREVVRKGLVSAKNLENGEIITPQKIAIKRVGKEAVSPADFEKVCGLKVCRPITEDEPLTWDDFKSDKSIQNNG